MKEKIRRVAQWNGGLVGSWKWNTGLAALLLFAAAEPAGAQLRPIARPADLSIPAPGGQVVSGFDDQALAVPESPRVGRETKLPLPRFVSLKTDEGNVRRGPAMNHRIDWVFVRQNMPLRITAEYENWRRVEDRDGEGGWIHYAMLSGTRTAIVDEDLLPLRTQPADDARETALLQQDVVALVEACQIEWCWISAGGYGGWAPKTALWGVEPGEVFE